MIEKLLKKEGWEIRFNNLILKYYDLPFQSGQNCCFLFVSDCYEALCCESPIAEWRGKFSTRLEGLLLYKQNTGHTNFETVFQWLEPVKNHKYAQRGDLGIWTDHNEMEVLGCVAMNGRDFLFRAEDNGGLHKIPLSDKMRFWRAL